jgi:hypothetical protein
VALAAVAVSTAGMLDSMLLDEAWVAPDAGYAKAVQLPQEDATIGARLLDEAWLEEYPRAAWLLQQSAV